MSPVDMGGQFDRMLKLGRDAHSFLGALRHGTTCYLMSLFIFQADAEDDVGAASGMGNPISSRSTR